MCAITGVPAHNTRVKYRAENSWRAAPHGSVTPKQKYQMSFLQACLVCFAPLLIGAWLIYFLLQVAFSSSIDPLYRIVAAFCAFSILLASSPSQGDLSFIKLGYQNDPQHSQYQILLVVLSFLISWLVVGMFNIIFPYEFFYYFIIVFCYIILKYSFLSLRILCKKLERRKGIIPTKIKRRLIRRRFRPEMVDRYYTDYEE